MVFRECIPKKSIRQHDRDSKIRFKNKTLWQTSSRCLVANFRDRVLRASALDDTQNSLHRDFSRSPHWWDSYHEPILQGILDWGPLEFPLNFLVGIYGCEGKQKKLKLEKEKNMKTQSVGFPCI